MTEQKNLTPEQAAIELQLTVGTLATWRARDKKRKRKGLAIQGPEWVNIAPAGSGRPIIRYPSDKLDLYQESSRRGKKRVSTEKGAEGESEHANIPAEQRDNGLN